jgi:hypothetical protein
MEFETTEILYCVIALAMITWGIMGTIDAIKQLKNDK